ncbi:MAG TPA: NADH:flavin oxidoreductase [Caulobacteraceae bacterium]|nr:NADH:flavin oxidoreductase [Caulobacteraceae bacterium]
MTIDLASPLAFAHGPAAPNRFMLAPLTNCQSHADGRLSDEEFRWLTMRAKGGFGAVMTCAAHVQRAGQGFPGQLGIFGDEHLPGLTRLAAAIKAEGSLALAQLHHAGMRSPATLIGEAPLAPSADEKTGARALSTAETEALAEDFIEAAVRAERAGFDGVEIHGAHGYVLCQYLSAETNRRSDRFGGSAEGRARIVGDILAGVRARCRPDFLLGLRLSPERFGLKLAEILDLARQVMGSGRLDWLDMSLWDVFKIPVEEAFQQRPLLDWFTELPRGRTRLGVAGKIMSAADARQVMARGADFPIVGRAAILHHDYARRAATDADFRPIATPVTRAHLAAEGLSPAFVEYMGNWPGFVADAATAEAAA